MKTEKSITSSYSYPISTFIVRRPTIFMMTIQKTDVSKLQRIKISKCANILSRFWNIWSRRDNQYFIGAT